MRDSWKETTLGAISEVIGGGTPPTAISEYWNGSIVWLTPTEITSQDGKVVSNSLRKISDSGLKNSGAQMLPKGSVILTSRASIGFVAISGIALCTNQGFQSLIPNESLIAKFLMFWIQQNRSEFESRSAGSTFKEISKSNVKSVKILLPTIPEQKRIVDLISSIDSYIQALQAQLISAIKFRNSILHQIMNAWTGLSTSFKLADIAQFLNGKAYSKGELLNHGKYRVLRVGNFFSNNNWYWSDLELESNKYCVKGDLLYAWSASFGPRIWEEEKVIFHYHIWKIVEDPSKVSKKWLCYWLEDDVERMKSATGNGSIMMHITKSEIEKRAISLPKLVDQAVHIELMESLDQMLASLSTSLKDISQLRRSLLSDLLSGHHEIPIRFDKLMDQVL